MIAAQKQWTLADMIAVQEDAEAVCVKEGYHPQAEQFRACAAFLRELADADKRMPDFAWADSGSNKVSKRCRPDFIRPSSLVLRSDALAALAERITECSEDCRLVCQAPAADGSCLNRQDR